MLLCTNQCPSLPCKPQSGGQSELSDNVLRHFWLYTFRCAGSVIITVKLILTVRKHLLELADTTANAASGKNPFNHT